MGSKTQQEYSKYKPQRTQNRLETKYKDWNQNTPRKVVKVGFGVVLLQKGDDGKFHPLQYMNKKISPQQKKYSNYEHEVLAIIEAPRKLRNYLIGNKFKIVTDSAAFQKTLNKKDLAPKVARWA